MKLSISQYNEIFKDRSITNYTKFNWLGEMPVVATYTFTTGFDTKSYASFGLERGKKYIIEVVKREVGQLTGGKTDAGWSCVSFKNQGLTTYTGVEVVDTTDTVQFTDIYCYGNDYNYADSIGQPIKTTIVIKEYVENLVLTSQYLTGNLVRSGDNYKGTFTDYEPITASLLSSHLAYGDYMINCDVNELKPDNGYIWVRNATKNIELFNSGYKGTFTLTPANYADGDTIYIYFHHNSAGGYLDITNFFVCKIQDDWTIVNANTIGNSYTKTSISLPGYIDIVMPYDIVAPETGTEKAQVYMTGFKTVEQNVWYNRDNFPDVFIVGRSTKKYNSIYFRPTDADFNTLTDEASIKTYLTNKLLMYKKAQ